MAWRPSNPPRSDSTTSVSPPYAEAAPAAPSRGEANARRVESPWVTSPAAAPLASIPFRNARRLGPPVSGQPHGFVRWVRVRVVIASPHPVERGVEQERHDVGQAPPEGLVARVHRGGRPLAEESEH